MKSGGGRPQLSVLARVRRIAVILAVQGLILFLVVEVASRLLDPLGISFYPESAAYFDTLIREEPIGYRNAPGLEGEFWGAPVSINSLGMRDRELDLEPAPGESRVLVLGDSVPFGLGVAYQDSIVHRLEERLNESAASGQRPYDLLSDEDRMVSMTYGAADTADQVYPARISYLIDPTGRIARTYATVDPAAHPEQALRDLP